jgi:hypothetical protein
LEDFSAAGYWWLPTIPESKVFGNVSFKLSSGFTLEIPAGMLGSVEEMAARVNRMSSFTALASVGTILGSIKDGRNVALYDCVASNFSLSMPGMPSETYRALRGVVGRAHIPAEARVQELRLRPDLLADWANESDLSVRLGSPEQGTLGENITIERAPVAERMITETPSLSVWLSHRGSLKGDPIRGLQVGHECRLRIVCKQPIQVNQAPDEIVSSVLKFLYVALDCPTGPHEVEIKTAENDEWAQLFFACGEPLEIPDRRQSPWMLFPLASEIVDTPSLLARWLLLEGDAERAASLLVTLIGEGPRRVDFRLLLAAQALESIHRFVMPRTELSLDDFHQRVAEVLQGCATPKTRSWAKHKLEYANTKPLSTQLTELYRYVGPVALRIAPDRQRFIDDLRRTRNFFAHGDESAGGPVEGRALSLVTEAAILLTRAAVLRVLEVPPARVMQVLMGNQGFLQVSARTAAHYARANRAGETGS